MPGEFKTVIPYLIDNPLLGLTWASCPSGIEIDNPVGINFLSKGDNIIFSIIFALRSNPEDCVVEYDGKS